LGFSQFLENPHSPVNCFGFDPANKKDLELLFHLTTGVIKRAGQLTAANMVAAAIKSGKGKNPLFPICINVDGSTYHKLFGLKQIVEKVLSDLLEERGVYYQLVKIDHSPIIGAAIAAFC
jgi:hexokinase